MTDPKLTRAAEMDLFAENERLRKAGVRLLAAYGAKREWPDNDLTKRFDAMLAECEFAEAEMRAALGQEG